MEVKVYSKPGCYQCDATKRHLDRLEIPYETIDVSTDHHAAQRLREMGQLQMPRVEARSDGWHDSWTGHRPSKIEELYERLEVGA